MDVALDSFDDFENELQEYEEQNKENGNS